MSGGETSDAERQIVEALMLLTNLVGPLHEFVLGQVAYFRSQGFTDPEAHAMASAEFVLAFGPPVARKPRKPPEAHDG